MKFFLLIINKLTGYVNYYFQFSVTKRLFA